MDCGPGAPGLGFIAIFSNALLQTPYSRGSVSTFVKREHLFQRSPTITMGPGQGLTPQEAD